MKRLSQYQWQRKSYILQRGPRFREGLFILFVASAIFLLIALLSYHASDPAWSTTGSLGDVRNFGGHVGAWLADIAYLAVGFLSLLFPPLLMLGGFWLLYRLAIAENQHKWRDVGCKLLGLLLLLVSLSGSLSLYFSALHGLLPAGAGGIFGHVIATGLIRSFNSEGSLVVLAAFFFCGITLLTGFSWLASIDTVGKSVFLLLKKERWAAPPTEKPAVLAKNPEKISLFTRLWIGLKRSRSATNSVALELPVEKRISKKIKQDIEKASVEKIQPAPTPVLPQGLAESTPDGDMQPYAPSLKIKPGNIPPYSLLNATPPSKQPAFTSISLPALANAVQASLADFGVAVKVVATFPGPVITRFELELAPGMKVSRISGLAKDLARSLSVSSVRVVEVIPGKAVIGLEIPNEHRELVYLRQILESERYRDMRSSATLALGRDIAGNPVVVDLTKMPHLLVAGTTGSGKSVSLNAMLLSMLYKATPDMLRLILIDPKMLELSVYEGIPHLLTPVITDMKEAANALRWCVAEMDRRYRLMAHAGVRNLHNYNHKIQEAEAEGEVIFGPEWYVDAENKPLPLTVQPTIVVIIDEFADMMMVVGKKVEELIARIAQKARAAGIHLLLATQRPSVDVITGLIKANIPTRVAFQVSSKIDSRTILDQSGAEQLLGYGDMLYLPPGTGLPVRVHGAFVADDEVHRVVAAWKKIGRPRYLEDIVEERDDDGKVSGAEGVTGEMDPLYDEAMNIVLETRRASISLVQRKLRIGYNRAARIIEDMEAAGVVTPMDTNGTREILVPER